MKIYNPSDIDKPTNITIQRLYGFLESSRTPQVRRDVSIYNNEIPLNLRKVDRRKDDLFSATGFTKAQVLTYPDEILELQDYEPLFSYRRTLTKNIEGLNYNKAQEYYQKLFASYFSIDLDYLEEQGQDDIQTEYEPSEGLVNVVCLSYQKREIEQKQFAKFEINKEPDFKKIFNEDLRENVEQYYASLYVAMQKKVAEAIKGFIASLGRTLTRGESFRLSKDGKVLDIFLEGFVYRLVISIDDAKDFGRYLYKDLFLAAQYNLLQSDFAKLILINGELVLEGLSEGEDIPRKRNLQKAEVIYPEF